MGGDCSAEPEFWQCQPLIWSSKGCKASEKVAGVVIVVKQTSCCANSAGRSTWSCSDDVRTSALAVEVVVWSILRGFGCCSDGLCVGSSKCTSKFRVTTAGGYVRRSTFSAIKPGASAAGEAGSVPRRSPRGLANGPLCVSDQCPYLLPLAERQPWHRQPTVAWVRDQSDHRSESKS